MTIETMIRPQVRGVVRRLLEARGVHVSGRASNAELARGVARSMRIPIPDGMELQSSMILAFARGGDRAAVAREARPFVEMKIGRDMQQALKRVAEYRAYYGTRSKYA